MKPTHTTIKVDGSSQTDVFVSSVPGAPPITKEGTLVPTRVVTKVRNAAKRAGVVLVAA